MCDDVMLWMETSMNYVYCTCIYIGMEESVCVYIMVWSEVSDK